jgi:ribonuclease HI
LKKVAIYTDGSCSGNPGPGGWGAILVYGKKEKEISGGEAATTNNRMELTSVIKALEALKEPCEVALYTDSRYVSDAINKNWLDGWRQKGWKRKGGEVKNLELWQRLAGLLDKHDVAFHWVKGHASDEDGGHSGYNNRCDALAVAETKKSAEKEGK